MLKKSHTAPANRSRLYAFATGIGLVLSTLAGQPATAEPDGPSSVELAEVHAAVDQAGVNGVAWYTDAKAGKVVVTTDSTVSAADRRVIRDAAGDSADALVLERAGGVFRSLLGPGDPIYGPDYRCSVAFNVRKGDMRYLLTAGHCGEQVDTWYADGSKTKLVGPTISSAYPGNDYAIVQYDNTSLKQPGGFRAGRTHVGQEVTRDGSTTGAHSGTVTAINVTVKYVDGVTMREMIQADICSEPGDSGGPLYDGSTALGIASGGSGECPDGMSFYQPILEVLADYDVRLY
jgi:streptogrisin B